MYHTEIGGVGKTNTQDHPYVMANEYICGRIAQALNLPVPPFALMRRNSSSTRMFVTLRFDEIKQVRNCNPCAVWQNFPDLASGILMYDVLIANSDRHQGNLKTDHKNNPRRLYLFDHERALFSYQRGRGRKRLRQYRQDPAIGPDHIIPGVLDTTQHLPVWNQKIKSIPAWYIRDICQEARGVGATKKELEDAADFLIYRKENLYPLLSSVRGMFINLNSPWPVVF